LLPSVRLNWQPAGPLINVVVPKHSSFLNAAMIVPGEQCMTSSILTCAYTPIEYCVPLGFCQPGSHEVVPFCATLTVRIIAVPDIVTIAVREPGEEFALVAVTVTVPLFELLGGDTVNHDALALVVQLIFELTVI
jgi:hypothetical protein